MGSNILRFELVPTLFTIRTDYTTFLITPPKFRYGYFNFKKFKLNSVFNYTNDSLAHISFGMIQKLATRLHIQDWEMNIVIVFTQCLRARAT